MGFDHVHEDRRSAGSGESNGRVSQWFYRSAKPAGGRLFGEQNFAGILQSRASQAVFATLLDVFPQCRAFQDVHGIPENATGKELINMVRPEVQMMV